MRMSQLLICLFLTTAFWSSSNLEKDYWITNAYVVDVKSGQLLDGLKDIHIKGDRISAIEKSLKKKKKVV